METVTHEAGPMNEEDSLRCRYREVKERIAQAAARSGRKADDVLLVAVTKYASIDQIRELLALGQVDLGESRGQVLSQHAAQVEEYLARARTLPSAARKGLPKQARWHMIGHLQRNKVRKVLSLVRLVHSLDSLRLAEEIQAVAGNRLEEPVELLIQVNVAGERQKYGIAPAATRHLIDQINTMLSIRVRGLMCMAPASDDPAASRPVFDRCRELFEEIRRTGCAGDRFDILSMGMSSDYEVAIECGANMVRVGSAIFGTTPNE